MDAAEGRDRSERIRGLFEEVVGLDADARAVRLNGTLAAAPFDATELRLTGEPISILDDIHPRRGWGEFSFSEDGTLAYVANRPQNERLHIVDRTGRLTEVVTAETGNFDYPRFSPDGQSVAVTKEGQTKIYGPAGALEIQTSTNALHWLADWSPTGDEVLLFRQVGSDARPYISGLTGLSPAAVMAGADTVLGRPWDWSRTSNLLLLGIPGWGVGFVDLDEGTDVRRLVPDGGSARFSPNTRFVAYASNRRAGRREVYVTDFPAAERRWQISEAGGSAPVWAPSGHELFFVVGSTVMVTDVDASGPTFRHGEPRELFAGPFDLLPLAGQMYDVHPAGNRFVVITASVSEIVIVHNWFDELRERAGDGG